MMLMPILKNLHRNLYLYPNYLLVNIFVFAVKIRLCMRMTRNVGLKKKMQITSSLSFKREVNTFSLFFLLAKSSKEQN